MGIGNKKCISVFFYILIVIMSSIVGGTFTSAFFVDVESTTGIVATADTFPPEDGAYAVDEEGNIVLVEESDLYDYDNSSIDLVIPEGSNPINGGNKQDISVTAKSITSKTDLSSKNAEISLTATDGDIDLGGTGTTINGGNGGVSISASGDVNLTGATITTDTQPITIDAGGKLIVDNANIRANNSADTYELTAGSISAQGATLYNKNGDILVSARAGDLDARSSSIIIDGGNAVTTLASNGQMILDDANLDSGNGDPIANLNQNGVTLHVNGTVINSGDGTLYYSPSDVIVEPSSRNGNDVVEDTN